jgi:hypothetical protein
MNIMNDLNEYLNQYFTKFKGGSLRIYGDWFGRPHDNFHIPKTFFFENSTLVITFEDDETLTIWDPAHVQIEEHIFRVGTASKVRWEWFYYGRSKIEKNRFFLEYKKDRREIHTDTNVDWYGPSFHASMNEPAVMLD